MMFLYILAAAVGIILDRVIIWDKSQAVKRERSYHLHQINDLEKHLEQVSMENYALRKERQKADDSRFYTNPNFEQEFTERGFAKTTIARGQAK